VNSFRIGANRVDAPKIPDNFGTWQDLGVNASSFLAPTVRLSVTGNGFAVGSGNSIFGLANSGPNYNIADDLNWVRGAHQFGLGANYLFELLNSKTGINATGLFTFNGATTGLSLADFLLGLGIGVDAGQSRPVLRQDAQPLSVCAGQLENHPAPECCVWRSMGALSFALRKITAGSRISIRVCSTKRSEQSFRERPSGIDFFRATRSGHRVTRSRTTGGICFFPGLGLSGIRKETGK